MKNNHLVATSQISASSTTNQSVSQICKLPKSKSADKSWRTLHQQFTEYGRNAKEWIRKCQFLLPQIEKQQIWRKKRFHNIYDYAAKLAGMNHDQVDDALWILRKIEDKPALLKVAEEKGLNAVRPILSIATQGNANFLADRSRNTSHHALRAYVKGIKQGLLIPSENYQSNRLEFRDVTEVQSVNLQNLPLETSDSSSCHSSQNSQFNSQRTAHASEFCASQKVTVTMQLDPEVADELQKIKGQGNWNETIGSLLKLRREKLEQEKPETVEVKTKPSTAINKSTPIKSNFKKPAICTSRAIPADIKKYVIVKTNGTCAFPCCYKPYKILHHTDRFAMYNIHDPDKIFPLCEAHERLAHLGLIENENQPPKYWKLRAQPDYDNPKYEIDQIVGKYRSKPLSSQSYESQ